MRHVPPLYVRISLPHVDHSHTNVSESLIWGLNSLPTRRDTIIGRTVSPMSVEDGCYIDGMSKAFTKESDGEEEEVDEADALPPNRRNYVTPAGLASLQDELHKLLHEERPKVVETVSWAAGNGDRSENGDYLYGKKRLREIDRRIRFLTKRLESAVVVDP